MGAQGQKASNSTKQRIYTVCLDVQWFDLIVTLLLRYNCSQMVRSEETQCHLSQSVTTDSERCPASLFDYSLSM